MGETDRSDVLRRKARSGRDVHQARVMSPQRALRLAMARAADELLELALSVNMIQLERVTQAEAVAGFRDDTLLMVLDGPDGAIGAASVEVSILAGLIEMQTMGQVLSGEAGSRAPTQTDAALVAPLLDASLEGFTENLGGEAEAHWADGVRFGARVESARMLSLLVEAADFHLFRLNVSLSEGAREGEIMIALPVLSPVEPEGLCEDATTCEGKLMLGQGALLSAEAPLSAVLHRIRLPLAEVSKLKPGHQLLVPREALNDTRLEAGPKSVVRKCRLGQINGFRAVRLISGAETVRQGNENGPQMEETDWEHSGLVSSTGSPWRLSDVSGAQKTQGAGAVAGTKPALPLPDESHVTGKTGAIVDQSDALPDLADLPDLGELGDLADLPELALDE